MVRTLSHKFKAVKVKELLLDFKPVPTGSERFFLTQEIREDLSLCLQMLQRRKKRSGLGPLRLCAWRIGSLSKFPRLQKSKFLQKAGHGIKRIKFEADNDEKAVLETITSSEVNSETCQTMGFPKLKECGGFELMNCIANCRNLSTLDCAWSAKSLKANIGGQSRIYLRPIQKDLCTEPLTEETPCEIKEKCNVCGQDVLVRNLRTHVYMRFEAEIIHSGSESEEGLPSSYQVDPLPRPEESSSSASANPGASSTADWKFKTLTYKMSQKNPLKVSFLKS
ncbi:Hypothetical predicted protein [Paramuricea clavata]|uniref:Uncharacterized protein n=1 Tax=Paramuricea clavata TaxID=317549 RepID=A0A6S7JBJ6_PARCT|nr:Hypothetical predicted protein [Paramuricea clavata]